VTHHPELLGVLDIPNLRAPLFSIFYYRGNLSLDNLSFSPLLLLGGLFSSFFLTRDFPRDRSTPDFLLLSPWAWRLGPLRLFCTIRDLFFKRTSFPSLTSEVHLFYLCPPSPQNVQMGLVSSLAVP